MHVKSRWEDATRVGEEYVGMQVPEWDDVMDASSWFDRSLYMCKRGMGGRGLGARKLSLTETTSPAMRWKPDLGFSKTCSCKRRARRLFAVLRS